MEILEGKDGQRTDEGIEMTKGKSLNFHIQAGVSLGLFCRRPVSQEMFIITLWSERIVVIKLSLESAELN